MRAAKDAVLAKITQSVQWNLTDVVHQQVQAFLTTEIAPEVEKLLQDEKDGIVAAARAAVAEIGNALSQTMVKTAAESLKGYKAREIYKALFGI